eukprot:500457_1
MANHKLNVMILSNEEKILVTLFREKFPNERSALLQHLSKDNNLLKYQIINHNNTNTDIKMYESDDNKLNILDNEDQNLQIAIQDSIKDKINQEYKEQQQNDHAIAIELQKQEHFEQKHKHDIDTNLVQYLLKMGLNIDDIFPSHNNSNNNKNKNRRHSEPINNINENNECTICLCEYSNDESKTVLPCMHVFHRYCINIWIRQHKTCPICRTNTNII